MAQLGPIATATAAVIALVVGVVTVVQRGRADRRAEWWRRAQWALDLSIDEDPRRARVGVAVATYLAESPLAGPDEAAMLRAAALPDVDSPQQQEHTERSVQSEDAQQEES